MHSNCTILIKLNVSTRTSWPKTCLKIKFLCDNHMYKQVLCLESRIPPRSLGFWSGKWYLKATICAVITARPFQWSELESTYFWKLKKKKITGSYSYLQLKSNITGNIYALLWKILIPNKEVICFTLQYKK